jgi:hypothetical protein
MTSDDKKTKAKPASKSDAPPKDKIDREAPKDAAAQKVAGSSAPPEQKDAVTSSDYSRGEGQKPVSKAYKENWNLIFAKKKKR